MYQEKTMVVSPHHHSPLNDWEMSETRNNSDTGPGAGTLSECHRSPGRCSLLQQRDLVIIILLLAKVDKRSEYCVNGMLL